MNKQEQLSVKGRFFTLTRETEQNFLAEAEQRVKARAAASTGWLALPRVISGVPDAGAG